MPRSLKALLVCVFLVSFLAIGFGAPPVRATTYEFTAISKHPSLFTDFSLMYTHDGPDPRFTFASLVPGSFEGPTAKGGNGWTAIALRSYGVPAYNVNDSPLTERTDGLVPGYWTFLSSGGTSVQAEDHYWTYAQTEVPLPPSVFLLGAGLIGLAVARRKKRKGQ